MDICLEDIFIPNVATILKNNNEDTNNTEDRHKNTPTNYFIALTYLLECCNEMGKENCCYKNETYINCANILYRIGFSTNNKNRWLWRKAHLLDSNKSYSIIIFSYCVEHLLFMRRPLINTSK